MASVSTASRCHGKWNWLLVQLAVGLYATQAFAATWTDALGRQVETVDVPHRIVSLCSSIISEKRSPVSLARLRNSVSSSSPELRIRTSMLAHFV